jgi:hypothetical protein
MEEKEQPGEDWTDIGEPDVEVEDIGEPDDFEDIIAVLDDHEKRLDALEGQVSVLAEMMTEKRQIKAGWKPLTREQYPAAMQDLEWFTITPRKTDQRTINLFTVEFREGVRMEVPRNFYNVAMEVGII